MTFYHFYAYPLLSSGPLNKHFLDTCCFNNLDYNYGLAIRCQKPGAQVNFYL